MNAELIEDIKLYARIDEDYGEVSALIEASIMYLKNAGIAKDYENALYILAIKMIVKHWYDNREITSNKNTEVPLGVTCIINQLQFNNLGYINEA